MSDMRDADRCALIFKRWPLQTDEIKGEGVEMWRCVKQGEERERERRGGCCNVCVFVE